MCKGENGKNILYEISVNDSQGSCATRLSNAFLQINRIFYSDGNAITSFKHIKYTHTPKKVQNISKWVN